MDTKTRKIWGPQRIESNGATTRAIELEPMFVGSHVHEIVFFLLVHEIKGSKTMVGLKLHHGATAAYVVDYGTIINLAVPSLPPSVLCGTTDSGTNGQLGAWIQPVVNCGQDTGGSGNESASVELWLVVKNV